MQLEHLTIALRPRPARQALDLGFALLHARAAVVYKAWLALWLPLVLVAAALTVALPEHAWAWLLLPWWLKPLAERGPLYVLSRQVFGEDVGWRQALRAWPGQLGGGWIRLLTWWRPLMAGRGLYQPIWQLEQARGATAAQRRAAIGRNGTGRAAYLFGVACAHFEAVLQIGLMAFIGMFTSEDQFKLFSYLVGGDSLAMQLLPLACLAVSGAIIGPIYVACCFTLYLNRRATLEAWDIELVLRQIHAPGERHAPQTAAGSAPLVAALLAPFALLGTLLLPPPADAAPPSLAPLAATAEPAAGATACASMPVLFPSEHLAAHDERQRALHREIDDIYAGDELRGYECTPVWRMKKTGKPEQKKPPAAPTDFSLLASIVRALLIAGAAAAVAWLLYRYRDRLLMLLPRPPAPAPATEIAGLDIRAESLPDDVTAAVRALWQRGAQREALALLYRASLSRLVQRHGVQLAQGATEGDCLRVAAQALRRRQLDDGAHAVIATVTALWLKGAYANRWPDGGAVAAACAAWDARWGSPA